MMRAPGQGGSPDSFPVRPAAMTRIHTAKTLAEAHLVRETLLGAGIMAELRGVSRPSLAGEIPIPDAMVSVWVMPEEGDRASEVLTAVEQRAHLEWICPVCTERNPASFEVCWRCPESSAG